MEIQLSEVINVALPAAAGAIGWLAGRQKEATRTIPPTLAAQQIKV